MVTGTSLIFLASLGAFAAHAGGASMMTGALRVTQWGALAMGLPAGVGAIFGTALQLGPIGNETADTNGRQWDILEHLIGL